MTARDFVQLENFSDRAFRRISIGKGVCINEQDIMGNEVVHSAFALGSVIHKNTVG